MRVKYVCMFLLLIIGPTSFAVSQSGPASNLRKCEWLGESPFCGHPTCAPGSKQVDRNKHGDGSRCWTGKKVLCCEDSLPPISPTSSSTTTTRRPEIRTTTTRLPEIRTTPPATPSTPPTRRTASPWDNPSDMNRHRGGHDFPIPIARDNSDDTRPRRPEAKTTPKPKLSAREEEILRFLKSIDDLS